MKSTNQFIQPVTMRTNSNDRLEIGGCDVIGLVEKYGTPLYVIDEQTIRNICQDYKSAFSKYEKVKMLYASKALCNMAISSVIASERFGFDAVSGGEIFTIYKSDADMSNVLFNGNNKSFDEISLALDLGVGRISVDNFFEISLLNEIAKSKNKSVNILLRITPGIECHTHEYIQTGQIDSKFGFDLSQIDEALELILTKCQNLNPKGLHAHIGSQIFETKVFSDEIEILVGELARINKKFALNLDEINIGGGIGVKYTENDRPPSIYETAETILSSLEKSIEKYKIDPPTFILEPGRSIISTSGVTLYTIGGSKQVPNSTKYVAIDGGMADNPRPAMYGADYSAFIVNKKEISLQKVTIAGRFCESGDILIKNIKLPNPENGDILCVLNTGAYNYSMASNYNRVQKPAMVLVNNSQSDIIEIRETFEDLVSHDVIPDRLKK